ncbi:MAG: ATP-binding protein [Treponema sp.]|jgi:AAA+ ATPase superfamily predicted ATPase|nr:ATP-binding protein [Treponema sp.]
MKFYDRKSELEELERIRTLAFTDHSRMTVVTGRRRIGKTSLTVRAFEQGKGVYLFAARKSEAGLCADFSEEISRALDTFVPPGITEFRNLFRYIMELAGRMPFTLVIDEFQEFYSINPSVYSEMQNIWDQHKDRTRLNLILAGSVYSMIQRIFQSYREPLFGRADNIINLAPFSIKAIKKIIADYRPKYSNDELLALYAFTGGVPKYVEAFCDNKALTVYGMIDFMVRDNSFFIEEGKHLLIEEFGRDYGTYFSILGAVARGINTQPEIAAMLGDKSIGGQIKRLIEDYRLLVRRRPILSKEGTQAVRFEIADNFLQFWFNYFDRRRSLIELGNFDALRAIIKADYETYSGRILERYFKQLLAESGEYRDTGSYWELKSGQNEIDIVALGLEKNRALAIEVKRQKKKFSPGLLAVKTEHLRQRQFRSYVIECRCLSMEDM